MGSRPGGAVNRFLHKKPNSSDKFNILNQASSTPAVDTAIQWAETQFFNLYLPTSPLSNALRNQARNYATTLDNYNNGLIGPGHCSE